jgi:DNA ligase-associated metallophosphoesterase
VSTLTVGGQALTLLPERAAFLPDSQTLLVADVHIGKAVSFRSFGVPVPRGTTGETLSALSALTSRLAVRRVVVLGDFLHSARALAPATWRTLSSWRQTHADLELTLVRGNHDRRAGDPPRELAVDVVDEPYALAGLALCHHPRRLPGAYVLAGHLHPCVHLHGRANDRLRLPCFWFGAAVGVLPAFGAFTGMHPIRPAVGERVFAIADGLVAELPQPAVDGLTEGRR